MQTTAERAPVSVENHVAPIFRRTPINPVLQQEIEQFYYWEARLLDGRHYKEWFDLLEQDIRYFMPIRTTRTLRDSRLEVSGSHDYAHFDDDMAMMKGRLTKVLSDVGWSENPASRTRHIVTNVTIEEVRDAGELLVRSAFILYRNRLERQVDIFMGERVDLLRRVDTECGFALAKRTILLDQSTLLSNNLSVFF
ncbi:MAG: 3-phenylpropionate/cinnamic acid dioxygenase subunit beta [Panacagrimonas sp.]